MVDCTVYCCVVVSPLSRNTNKVQESRMSLWHVWFEKIRKEERWEEKKNKKRVRDELTGQPSNKINIDPFSSSNFVSLSLLFTLFFSSHLIKRSLFNWSSEFLGLQVYKIIWMDVWLFISQPGKRQNKSKIKRSINEIERVETNWAGLFWWKIKFLLYVSKQQDQVGSCI